MKLVSQDTVRERFFQPVEEALEGARRRRLCHSYTDESFIISGISRVIAQVQSGRDWVQKLRATVLPAIKVGAFFQALRSVRRLALTEEVAEHIRDQVDRECGASHDPLAEHEELRGIEVYASDGHYEAAATHTRPIGGKVRAQGYFFSLNLRSHSLSLLDIARPKNKKEHDITALKRLIPKKLRMNAPKGTKVIHAYDPAAIDYMQWMKWKTRGIYFISREKGNSNPQVVGHRDYNDEDPRNIGILSDENVGVFSGVLIRRVRYQDPAGGDVFSFMTNEFTLPPGLIAFIYKLRWDIEKVFDEKKNKLGENKAWATTDEAKSIQAHFVCMAHNLMVLLERSLDRDEGLRDEKSLAKQRKRLAELEEKIRAEGRLPNPLVLKCQRATQRSLQFIRWLRHALEFGTSWEASIQQLRPLMAKYLT
jgi:hypothetical protein